MCSELYCSSSSNSRPVQLGFGRVLVASAAASPICRTCTDAGVVQLKYSYCTCNPMIGVVQLTVRDMLKDEQETRALLFATCWARATPTRGRGSEAAVPPAQVQMGVGHWKKSGMDSACFVAGEQGRSVGVFRSSADANAPLNIESFSSAPLLRSGLLTVRSDAVFVYMGWANWMRVGKEASAWTAASMSFCLSPTASV